MKKILWLTLSVTSFLFLLAVISGHTSDSRRGVVIAEPLACHQQDQNLICIDGNPLGKLKCENLEDQAVLCSSEK
jgi:hypothetical protein